MIPENSRSKHFISDIQNSIAEPEFVLTIEEMKALAVETERAWLTLNVMTHGTTEDDTIISGLRAIS